LAQASSDRSLLPAAGLAIQCSAPVNGLRCRCKSRPECRSLLGMRLTRQAWRWQEIIPGCSSHMRVAGQ
jgi:hypothetical protein